MNRKTILVVTVGNKRGVCVRAFWGFKRNNFQIQYIAVFCRLENVYCIVVVHFVFLNMCGRFIKLVDLG
jgi:hypothetical protein